MVASLKALLADYEPDQIKPDPVEWGESKIHVANSTRSGLLIFDEWQKEPLRCMVGDRDVYSTTLCIGSQMGKTLLEMIALGYIIDVDPKGVLCMFAGGTQKNKWVQEKVEPFLLGAPDIREKLGLTQRGSLPDKLWRHNKYYSIALGLSGSRNDSRSTTAGLVLGDEVDDWENPRIVHDLRQRGITDPNFRLGFVGTPTKGNIEESLMLRLFYDGTAEVWVVTCPHCANSPDGPYRDEMEPKGFQNGMYHCIRCGAGWSEVERLTALRNGEWVATNPDADPRDRSFRIGCLAAPGILYPELTKLISEGDEQHNMTQIHAREWVDLDQPELKTSEIKRFDTIPFEPEYITIGCDVQQDRIEWAAVGWNYNLSKGHIWHWSTEPRDDVGECGLKLREQVCAVTKEFHGITVDRRYDQPWVMRMLNHSFGDVLFNEPLFAEMCYGYANPNAIPDASIRGPSSDTNGVRVSTADAKRVLMAELKRGNITLDSKLGSGAEAQLTSEILVRESHNGKVRRTWVRKRSQRNELLDCLVYAFAGALRLYKLE